MGHMSELTREERVKRLRELIQRLRREPLKGHEPYLLDAIEMLTDNMEDDCSHRGGQ